MPKLQTDRLIDKHTNRQIENISYSFPDHTINRLEQVGQKPLFPLSLISISQKGHSLLETGKCPWTQHSPTQQKITAKFIVYGW